MKFILSVDRQTDGQWVADCPTLDGCRSTGATKEEAMANAETRIRQLVAERAGPAETPSTIEVLEQEKSDWQPPEKL
ncbi:type II toxin-antitoxin system HicB family antitoxin [Candidatus Laterigemmans baculatus]|uniref:type II toxin-antitoxin system HicB family antitoxin n=1 Tax=Candidatus Laterigemmans baculatus TaxID=2770505 RepID=UPI00193C5E18|nr:type II toxin-antitoxin system HicB family antitoxin [Candidatus Laterigemmans baculatus]